jgi:hypothetical protein
VPAVPKVASKLATTTVDRLRGSAKLYYGVVQHEDYKLARELHGPGKVVRGYPSKDTPMTPSVGFRVTLVNGALGNLSAFGIYMSPQDVLTDDGDFSKCAVCGGKIEAGDEKRCDGQAALPPRAQLSMPIHCRALELRIQGRR